MDLTSPFCGESNHVPKPIPASLFRALHCAGVGVGLALFTGCVTVRHLTPLEVTSPPPPNVGSAPIIAQDSFARALFPSPAIRDRAFVTSVHPAFGSPSAIQPKGSSALIPTGLN